MGVIVAMWMDLTAPVMRAGEEKTGIVVFTRVDDPATERGSELCRQMPLHAAAGRQSLSCATSSSRKAGTIP